MLREFFSKDHVKSKIEDNEKSIEELLEKIEQADRETAEIFEELDLSPSQIEQLLSSRENFSDADWKKIQQQVDEMEERLTFQRDITKTRSRYKERSQVQQQWIYVR